MSLNLEMDSAQLARAQLLAYQQRMRFPTEQPMRDDGLQTEPDTAAKVIAVLSTY